MKEQLCPCGKRRTLGKCIGAAAFADAAALLALSQTVLTALDEAAVVLDALLTASDSWTRPAALVLAVFVASV